MSESESTALINWEERLAEEAKIAAEIEKNTGGGRFISTQSGVLSIGKIPLPGNQMTVVMLDCVFENILYVDGYDVDNIRPPSCYALARVDTDLKPMPNVFAAGQQQHEICNGCKQNEWNSADKGKGKACGNKRRIALIPAGTTLANGVFTPFTSINEFLGSPIVYIRPPVTSVIHYANFVKQVSGVLNRPPHGIFTKISLTPDPKTQFKMNFEVVDKVPVEFMGAVYKRREEAMRDIMFELDLAVAEEEEVVEKPKQQVINKAKSGVVRKPAKY